MGVDEVTTVILDANKEITLTANRYTIGEDEIAARITLTATRSGTEGEVTVTADLPPGGTATPGSLGDSQDYVIWSRWRITIPDGATSGSTSQALGFTMTDDDFEEGDETIILNGRATGGLTVAPVVLTIVDNDQHDITLTASRYTVREGEAAARVTLTATRSGTGGEVAVTGVLPPGGTATPGALGDPQDYVVWSRWQITIPDGARSASTTQALGFTVTDDNEVEDDETIILGGTATGGLSVSPVVLTIGDNDTDDIELSVNPGTLGESDGATSVTVTATLQGGARSSDTVVTIGALSGTATNSADYTATPLSSITIPTDSTSGTGTFTVTPVSDPLEERDETIFVEGTTTAGLSVGRAVLTIRDEYINNIALSVNRSRISEDAGATGVTVTATRDTARDVETVVKLSLAGTARIQDDYTAALPVTITIPANQTTGTATLTVTPVHDGLEESNETIRLYGTAICHTVTTTDITLTNADPPPIAETVHVSGPATVMERNFATYTIYLSPAGSAPSADLTVDYATADGSDPYLGPAAVAGTDYTAKSGTVTFTPTDAGPQTVTVPILGDTSTDSGEVFTFGLSNLQGGGESAPSVGVDKVTTVILDANKDITLTADRYTIGEHEIAARITLTATRSGTNGEVTITPDFPPGGTATPGSLGDSQDYVIWSGWRITIPDGATSASTSQALGFTITDDDFEEGDETIILNGRATGGLTVAPAILTVKDNDRHDITLTASRYTIGENEAAARVTLTATRSGTEGEVTITGVLPPGGTAEAGALGDPKDYVIWSGWQITIPDGATSASTTQALGFTVTDDDEVEGDETIILGGTAPGGLSVGPVVLTVGDNDTDDIELSVSPTSLGESDGATSVTVTATLQGSARSSDTVVTIGALSGTATNSADYTATTLSSITIPANSTTGTGTFTVTPVSDPLEESDETVFVEGTTTAGLTVGRAVLTIEDEYVNNIALSVSQSTIAEDAGATEVTVTATRDTARDVDTVVKLSLAGTAEIQDDYTAPLPVTITIPANQTTGTATLTITPVHDALEESNEIIRLYGTAICHTVTTTDITLTNAAAVAPVISFQTAPTTVAEGSAATYTVKVEGSRTTDITVRFKTGADDDLATAGRDYTAVDSTITFGPTDNTKTVTVQTTNDQWFEVPETFTVSLSNPQGGGGLTPVISDGTKTTTITEDFKDQPAYPDSYTLSAAPTTLSEGDDATEITFTATLGGKNAFPVPVDVIAHVSDSGPKGTAALTDDYTVSGTHGRYLVITIPANQSSATGTLTLDPVDDDQVEGDETVIFTSLGGGGIRTADRPTLTITDDDTAPTSITLSASPSVLREGPKATDNAVTVTATLDGDATLTTSTAVAVSLADGTAIADSDYSAASATVTIPKGESSGSASLSVKVLDDTTAEQAETVKVTGTAQRFTVNPAEIIILDDDGTATGIMLHASPSSVSEDAGDTDMVVTAAFRDGTTRDSATVIALFLADGTATLAGGDYSASTGTVTIPAGQFYGTGTFEFTPKNDSIVEPDETVLLEGSSKDYTVTPAATITIKDSTRGELSITGPASAVAEGSDASFTVTLSKAVAAQVQVAWSAPLGTDAAEGADLSATSGTVTFAANSAAGATQTITITATDDALSETSEAFTVTLGTITSTASSQLSLKSDASSATATISESDPITINISGPSTVDEGDATTSYTVSLSPSGVTPTADLTVSYATANGTATAGSDYTAKSGTLTFTNSAAGSQTFTVQTTDDTVDEGTGETFTVSISSPSGGGGPTVSLGTSTVTTTITDDDNAPTGITLSADPSSLGEDDGETTVTVTATLAGGTLPSDTVVTVGTFTGGATKGTDYTATALASVTIPANSDKGSATFKITPTDDSVVEGDETITIPGSTTVSGLSVTSATVTLTDDDKTTTTPTDDKDSAVLSISGPASNVAEGGDAEFTVTLSRRWRPRFRWPGPPRWPRMPQKARICRPRRARSRSRRTVRQALPRRSPLPPPMMRCRRRRRGSR